ILVRVRLRVDDHRRGPEPGHRVLDDPDRRVSLGDGRVPELAAHELRPDDPGRRFGFSLAGCVGTAAPAPREHPECDLAAEGPIARKGAETAEFDVVGMGADGEGASEKVIGTRLRHWPASLGKTTSASI